MTLAGMPLPKRGQLHSFYFKARSLQGGNVRIMGPYPNPQTAIAAREVMRSAGYLVGEISND